MAKCIIFRSTTFSIATFSGQQHNCVLRRHFQLGAQYSKRKYFRENVVIETERLQSLFVMKINWLQRQYIFWVSSDTRSKGAKWTNAFGKRKLMRFDSSNVKCEWIYCLCWSIYWFLFCHMMCTHVVDAGLGTALNFISMTGNANGNENISTKKNKPRTRTTTEANNQSREFFI